MDTLIQLGILGRDEYPDRNIYCPFHAFGHERKPSGRIYPEADNCEAGQYYCFTCGRPWNPIQFVSDYKHIPFWEAVKWLERVFEVTPPTIEEAVEKKLQPPKKDIGSYYSLEAALEEIDRMLWRGRRMIPTRQFRLLSDVSDILWCQVEQGSSESGRRVAQFMDKVRKVVGLVRIQGDDG